jgi:hypothetical protein
LDCDYELPYVFREELRFYEWMSTYCDKLERIRMLALGDYADRLKTNTDLFDRAPGVNNYMPKMPGVELSFEGRHGSCLKLLKAKLEFSLRD